MRSEAGRATGLGSVLTSVGDATQAKTAEAEALASALQQQGMIIAQEKARAIQQSLAEIKDAQMVDYAMARERRAAAQTMADSLGKALAFYGSYKMPQVDPAYAQALDDLGPNASPEQIKAHIKGQQSV
jgi:poly(A) polymerase Pap1